MHVTCMIVHGLLHVTALQHNAQDAYEDDFEAASSADSARRRAEFEASFANELQPNVLPPCTGVTRDHRVCNMGKIGDRTTVLLLL